MTKHKEKHIELLVLKLKNGDKCAFRELFDEFQSSIYAYSFSILKSEPYAQEIVQDVFLKLWLNREKLDHTLSVKSYIFTVARNMAFNFLSKAANDRVLREAIFYKSQINYGSPDRNLIEADYEILKNEAIDKLTPRCKLVFLMSREEGKTYEEIAQELDISVNTVKNQISKSLATIKEFLSANGDIVFLLAFLME